MAEPQRTARPERQREQPAIPEMKPPEEQKPEEKPEPTNGAPDVNALRAELAELKTREKKRGTVLRTLAATVLMPQAPGADGSARRQNIRAALQALVEEFAPEGEE